MKTAEADASPFDLLSPREHEVLNLAVEGLTDEQIARRSASRLPPSTATGCESGASSAN